MSGPWQALQTMQVSSSVMSQCCAFEAMAITYKPHHTKRILFS